VDTRKETLLSSGEGFFSESPEQNQGGCPRVLSREVLSVLPVPTRVVDCGIEEDLTSVGTENRFDSVQLERRGITSHLKQGQLWQKESMWRDTLVARVREVGRGHLVEHLDLCHRETSVRVCCGCNGTRIFWNRCELKFCPICAERLARERRETVEAWTRQIRQPKHVVLTVRNSTDISTAYLKRFKLNFARLRRTKFCSNWLGGFYSIECTWTKNDGFHVHLHALVNARWIDAVELSKTWGRLVGQDFAIVKVKDARSKSYLQEVAKYVVKGSELAQWDGNHIADFIEAIDGVRMFGVFGDLYKLRKEIREWLDTVHNLRNVCECGCRNFRVMDERCWEFEEIQRELACALSPPRTPERLFRHPELQL